MANSIERGETAVESVFSRARTEKRAVFIPYFPIGYPDYPTSLEILRKLVEAGADLIEVGVPFSDPLADGPVIQAATQMALLNGVTVRSCLEAIGQLRAEGITTAMILMGYLNPFMAYGIERLIQDAKNAGVDGFIVPDLPPDEADFFQSHVEAAGLALPHFLAPTSHADRIRLVSHQSRGYIYLVSITGVTGTRDSLPADLVHHIAEIRAVTPRPIAVGFGISSPEQAAQVGKLADGIIVGSALIKAAAKSPQMVYLLAQSIYNALKQSHSFT